MLCKSVGFPRTISYLTSASFLIFYWQLTSCCAFQCSISDSRSCLSNEAPTLSEYITSLECNSFSLHFNNLSKPFRNSTQFFYGIVNFADDANKSGNVSCTLQRRRQRRSLDCEVSYSGDIEIVQPEANRNRARSCRCTCGSSAENNASALINGHHTYIDLKGSLNDHANIVYIICQEKPSEKSAVVTIRSVYGVQDGFRWFVRCFKLAVGVECRNISNGTLVHGEVVEAKNNESTIRCENLTNGNYCVKVCPDHDCGNIYHKFFSMDLPERDVIESSPDNTFVIVLPVIISIVFVIILAIVFGFCHKRKVNQGRLPDLPAKMPYDWSTLKTKTVYVAYDRESNEHISLVCAFADVLKRCLRCQVIIDESDLSEVLSNVPCWVELQLDKVDVILIVNSKGTYLWEKDVVYEQRYEPRPEAVNPKNIFQIFLTSILLKPRLRMNYNRVFHVKFDHVKNHHTIRTIAPGRIYRIPYDLRKLFLHIHEIDENLISESDWPNWDLSELSSRLTAVGSSPAIINHDENESRSTTFVAVESDTDGNSTNGSLTLLLKDNDSSMGS